jgi:hypothetical protein
VFLPAELGEDLDRWPTPFLAATGRSTRRGVVKLTGTTEQGRCNGLRLHAAAATPLGLILAGKQVQHFAFGVDGARQSNMR